jgi:hypothetical protein
VCHAKLLKWCVCTKCVARVQEKVEKANGKA